MQANWENAFLITGVPYKRVLSHTFNCDWGEEYHSLHRSVDIKGARHPQENSQMKETGMLIVSINIVCIYYFSVIGYQMNHSVLCLTCYFSVFGYQMNHSVSCLIYYSSVFGYQMKHSLSCLIYYFSVTGYQMNHSVLCLTCYFSVFGYQMNHSVLCLIYYL